MKALIQRVSRCEVSVDDRMISSIGAGYLVLLGAREGDSAPDAGHLARKTASLRILPDSQDRMNLSIMDTGGEVLVVSQFTLYADTRKGNRPSFIAAGDPGTARSLYEMYVESLRKIIGVDRVKTGIFGAKMKVALVNEGPVTIELASEG